MMTSFFKSGYPQAVLILVVMTVLCMMVLPLSPALLDFLLAMNIVGTLTLLVVTLSVSDVMQLSSFPTLLLIGTLFRLGLNVSSSRMILSRAHAGQIIKTFGVFATEGNLFVGIVVFLVLMVVQYIVVSKGAERVAEVSARFTLDALPGKQMSIDADLRAGMITSEEAAQKRTELIKESKFYGSMDGAMKFVKGDTIAGFVIMFINILGGLVVGVFQRDFSLSYAGKLYTLLTVGEGLVAQIPALLMSLSAGLIVTRVNDHQDGTSLGNEICSQILRQPTHLLIVAGMSFLLGLVPGFPFWLFFFIAVGVGGAGWFLLQRVKTDFKEGSSINQHKLDLATEHIKLGLATPFLLEFSSDIYSKFLQDDRWRVCLNHLFPKLKAHLSNQLGVPFPDLKIAIDPVLATERYVIKIFDIPVDKGFLSPVHCVVPNSSCIKSAIDIQYIEKSTETAHGTRVKLFALDQQALLVSQGIQFQAPEERLLRHLAKTLKKHGADFIGIQEVRDILNSVEQQNPELVHEVVPRMLTIHKLTGIVKRLVSEGVPVKDFRLILETLSGVQPENKDVVDLTEMVRVGLSRVISHQYADDQNCLNCFCLDPEIEDSVTQHIHREAGECYLTMPPEQIQKIMQGVRHTYRLHRINQREAVILTNQEARRYIKKIIEIELPDVAVLSYQELDPKICINPRDTISLIISN